MKLFSSSSPVFSPVLFWDGLMPSTAQSHPLMIF